MDKDDLIERIETLENDCDTLSAALRDTKKDKDRLQERIEDLKIFKEQNNKLLSILEYLMGIVDYPRLRK